MNYFKLIALLSLMSFKSYYIDPGNYILCFKMYWECHTSIHLDLLENSTYRFRLIDDTSIKETFGSYIEDESKIILTPAKIPDTIQMSKYEGQLTKYLAKYHFNIDLMSARKRKANLLILNHYYEPLTQKNIDLLIGDQWINNETDSIGRVVYYGEVADSVRFTYDGREINMDINEQNSTFVRLSVKDNYKDLVYRVLGHNIISVKNNKMFLKVREEDRDEEILYFKRK